MLTQWSHETMFAIVIVKVCRQHLEEKLTDRTEAPPLHPAGDFRPQIPWLRPRR